MAGNYGTPYSLSVINNNGADVYIRNSSDPIGIESRYYPFLEQNNIVEMPPLGGWYRVRHTAPG